MSTLSLRRHHSHYNTPVNILDLYGIERVDLQEMRISFKVGWRDRGALIHDLDGYCKFKGFTFDLKHDGGWRVTRYVLAARGTNEQMAALEIYLKQHPLFGAASGAAVTVPY